MIFSELGILESITPPEAGMGEPEMDLSNQEYDALVRSKAKPSPLWKDLAWAFCVGGGICVVGQGLMEWYQSLGLEQEQAGTAVSVTLVLAAALAVLAQGGIDLVILDIMMPFMDGMTCLREMRTRKIMTPVIMLTARSEEYDKLAGLEGGADDYVVKPFSPRELVARVKAVLARTMPKPAENSGVFTFGDLVIDTASHSVKVAGQEAPLTPKEFDLLVFLVNNKGIALSREKILQQVWNYDYYGEDRTVDTHIKMLRGHLGPCRKFIVTVWGIGYKFDPEVLS